MKQLPKSFGLELSDFNKATFTELGKIRTAVEKFCQIMIEMGYTVFKTYDPCEMKTVWKFRLK